VPDSTPVVDFDERRIDAVLSHLNQCHLPGAAVGVSIRGKPVYRKGFGLANMELPILLSPTIRLRVGSVSKQFTCFTFVLLCQDGKAKIDDPLGSFLPELHPVTHSVTMRQLMGHTGGLRDVYSVFDRFNEPYTHHGGAAQSVSSADLLSLYRDIDDVDAAPGAAWIYNNGAYLLLSAVIERISGQAVEQVMRERVFEPIGMYDSMFLRSDNKYIANRASQHALNPLEGYEKLSWGVDSHSGAGAVISTVDDLLLWLAYWDAPAIGCVAAWEEMRKEQTLLNGTSTGYGLGLKLGCYRGISTISHAGNALGGSAQVLKVPAVGLDVAVLVNRQDVLAPLLMTQILDACMPHLTRPKQLVSHLFATGVFRSPISGTVIELSAKSYKELGHERRQIVSINGLDLPYEPDKGGVLRPAFDSEDRKQSITLVGNPQYPEAIRFNDFGNADELLRVEQDHRVDERGIVGAYRSDAIRTDATVAKTEIDLRLATRGPFGAMEYRLDYLAEGIWTAKPAIPSRVAYQAGILTFDPDGALVFSSYQFRSPAFTRLSP
jgi:D-aminopeptidase